MIIGILGEDAALVEQLGALLESQGYRYHVRANPHALIDFLAHETVDLLLVDTKVEGWRSFIRRIRLEHARFPAIVVIVSLEAEDDIVYALNWGADGYALTPLQPTILLARIGSLVKHMSTDGPGPRIERFGPYTFDRASKTVQVHGNSIPLSERQFALALMLFRNTDRILSRRYIFQRLWGRELLLESRTLDTHVAKLRNLLGLRAEHGFHLTTIYGRGYRLETVGQSDDASMQGTVKSDENDDLGANGGAVDHPNAAVQARFAPLIHNRKTS